MDGRRGSHSSLALIVVGLALAFFVDFALPPSLARSVLTPAALLLLFLGFFLYVRSRTVTRRI
jgi:hypothetical protein